MTCGWMLLHRSSPERSCFLRLLLPFSWQQMPATPYGRLLASSDSAEIDGSTAGRRRLQTPRHSKRRLRL